MGRAHLIQQNIRATRPFVTVEHVIEGSLYDSEETAASTLPALYVSGVAQAKNGAWPYGLGGEYEPDTEALRAYAQAARTQEGFDEWLAAFVSEAAQT